MILISIWFRILFDVTQLVIPQVIGIAADIAELNPVVTTV